MNLGLILFKRLHIEGSTLRSRSLDYQANLIERYLLELLLITVTSYLILSPDLNRISSQKLQEKMVTDLSGHIFIR